jgi:ADP-ribose pyrophosphatase
METDFETISSENVYDGRIFNVFSDSVRLPNGNVTTRDYIQHIGAVTILPVAEDGTIHLIEQFRYPVRGSILEIPAGTLEKDEDRDTCAARELTEETGFRAKKMEEIVTFFLAPGYSNELITLYRATGLEMAETNLDKNEIIELKSVSLDESIEMIKDGRIQDSKTMMALLYERMLRNG